MLGTAAYISIGDEYDKKDNIPDRFKGKSMLSSNTKSGQGALFSKKYLSLSEGDKYVDPGYYDKRYKLENEKKKITPQGFRYTSSTKKPGGSGTYYGTFDEKSPHKHEVEYAVTKRGEMPDKMKPNPRNIVTSSTKKGTYGFPSVTISKGDEFKYVSDPYDNEKRKEAMKAKESTKRIVGPPFKGACKRQNCFDESGHGVSKVYSIDKALPAKKPAGEEPKQALRGAWKPASTLVAAMTKAPEYLEDPYEMKEKTLREQRKKDRPKMIWKPISSMKSLPTKAIKMFSTPV